MRKAEIEVRMEELVRCATRVFCEKGYRQTQMSDIAKEMGVAAGTLYLYVEGKEALFDLVVRHGVETGSKDLPKEFPIRNPARGETLDYVKKALSERGKWPKLRAGLKRKEAEDPRSELFEIIQELYSLMLRNRWGLILIARSALDFPGLGEVFLNDLRKRLLRDLTKYVKSRVEAGQFLQPADVNVAAVFINETIAWTVLHRMCDPEFRLFSDEQMNATVVSALVNSLVPDNARN